MYKGRRILALLLAFCTIFGQIPFKAFAEVANTPGDPAPIFASVANGDGTTTVNFTPDFDETAEIQALQQNAPASRSMTRAGAAPVDYSTFLVDYAIDLTTMAAGGKDFLWNQTMAGVDNTFTLTQIDPATNLEVPGGTQTVEVTSAGTVKFPNKVRIYNDAGEKYRYALTMPGDVVLKSTINSITTSGSYDSQTDPKTYTIGVEFRRLASTEISAVYNLAPGTDEPALTGIFSGVDYPSFLPRDYEFNIPATGSTVLRSDFTSRDTDQPMIAPLAMAELAADPADSLEYSISVKGAEQLSLDEEPFKGKITIGVGDNAKTFYIETVYNEVTGGVYTVSEEMTVKFFDGTATDPIATVPVPYEKTFEAAGGTVPADPTPPEGKTFEGWFVGDTPFDPAALVTTNVTVTAKFSDTDAAKYTPVAEPEVIQKGGTYDLTDNVTINDAEGNPVIFEPGKEPTFTDVTPANTIDADTPGEYIGKVEVTYADGSKEVVDVPVTVQDKIVPIEDPNDPVPAGYHRVEFDPNVNGTFTQPADRHYIVGKDGLVRFNVLNGVTFNEVMAVMPKSQTDVTPNVGFVVKQAPNDWSTDKEGAVLGLPADDFTGIDESGVYPKQTYYVQYGQTITDTDPNDDRFVKVEFSSGLNGGFLAGEVKDTLWALKGTKASEVFTAANLEYNTAKNINVTPGFEFVDYKDNTTAEVVTADTVIPDQGPVLYTAQYKSIEKSAPPEINVPVVGDEKITGTGIPGSTISVILPDGQVLTATVGPAGIWETVDPIVTPLVKGDTIQATQAEENKLPSDPAANTVVDRIIPFENTENPDPNRFVLVSITSGEGGNFSGNMGGLNHEEKRYYVVIDPVNPVNAEEVFTEAGLNSLSADGITVLTGYEFLGWEPDARIFITDINENYSFTAQYETLPDVIPDPDPNNPIDPPVNYLKVEFLPGANGTLTGTTVYYVNPVKDVTLGHADIVKPTINPNTGFEVADPAWDVADDTLIRDTDVEVTAQYTPLGDVIPDPDPDNPITPPAGYLKVEFLPGNNGTLAGTTVYYVNPDKNVTLGHADIVKPTITAKTGFEVANPAWDVADGTVIAAATQVTAQYSKLDDVIPDPEDPDNPIDPPAGYVTVEFAAGANGTLEGTKKFYVNPEAGKTYADLTVPTIKANTGFEVADPAWDPNFATTDVIGADAKHTAQYSKLDDVIPTDPEDPQTTEGYVLVTFEAGTTGTFAPDAKTAFNVKEGTPFSEVKAVMPTATPNEGFANNGWAPELPVDDAPVTEAATYVAQYVKGFTVDPDIAAKGAKYGNETDYKVTFKGTGTPGATVVVKVDNGTLKLNATVDEKGMWEVTSEAITSAIHAQLGFKESPKVVNGVAVDLTATDPVQDIKDKIAAAGISAVTFTQTANGIESEIKLEKGIQRLDVDSDYLYDDEEELEEGLTLTLSAWNNADTDGDDLLDGEEYYGFKNTLDYRRTAWNNPDTDGDDVLDGAEVAKKSNPLKYDEKPL